MINKYKIYIAIAILLLVVICGWLIIDLTPKPIANKYSANQLFISYPYTASTGRKDEIMNNRFVDYIGMKEEDVISIIGRPDEIRLTYSGIFSSKPCGYSYWYYINKFKSNDYYNDKAFRLIFRNDNIVEAIDSWGLER